MKSTLAKTIGERIMALRLSKDVAPRDLAGAAGISLKLLTMIERGDTAVAGEVLVAIAGALDVTSSVLTGEEKFDHYQRRQRRQAASK